MAVPATKLKEQKEIIDVGLEEGAARLTYERIEQVINRVITGEMAARMKVYVDTCIHCGMCSTACHYYLSHGTPEWAPVGKVKQTMWEILEKKGRVSPEFIKRASIIASTECNVCRRCSMYCPYGIDIAYIMATVRRICHLLGVTPQYIQDTAHSHSATMNQMWVKEDEWIDTLQWQEGEAQAEIPSLRIPLDKEGADIMYSVIGPEPKFRAQLIYQAAILMTAAGVNWTMPSGPGWDNSDMAMFTGDFETMGRVKRTHFETAANLRVKKIVMGECGHAFRSVYDVGNRWLGWKMPPIPVIHATQFYYELLKEGKIKIARKFKEPVTLHDPCNIVRGRGLHEMMRYLVNATCENFVEMYPNREHNHCCCAGGGVINCGPPWKTKRVESNSTKAEQLAATGVHICIAPCHNCHGGLEDIINYYKLNMHVMFFIDILMKTMEIPDSLKA
ncbi:MAG: (Fe-S)-binding protein [Thermodesulfobacteriota bacterium]|nr:(Fe-S)-binding protein [Thermodesulfobacteriota bacterium]